MRKLKWKVLRLAIKYIIWYSKDSNYLKRANEEYKIAWKEDDEMQNYMCGQINELLALLATQGDSGSSICYKLSLFKRLAMFKTIAPLTFKDDEFDETYNKDEPCQNKRDSSIFKYSDGTYSFNDDVIKRGAFYIGNNNVVIKGNNNTYTSSGVFVLTEKGEIYYINKLRIKDITTFKPEPSYIDVYEVEQPKDWWLSIVKESNLTEVFNRYTYTIDNTNINKELNFKDKKYRIDIIERIKTIGKHMYDNTFKLNINDINID